MSTYKSYSGKLLDPRWQKKRLKIFGRDNFACQLCNDEKETLHVHHLKYAPSRNPWDAPDEDLVTYCSVCHQLVEFISKKEKAVLVKKHYESDEKSYLFLVLDYMGNRYMGIYNYDRKTKQIERITAVNEKKINLFIELFALANETKKLEPMSI